jgi:hypothetical protein
MWRVSLRSCRRICRYCNEHNSNRLFHFFIATHAHVAQQLLQVKITWSQVWTVGRMEKNMFQVFCVLKSRITSRTSQSAGFSDFLLQKSQNDVISASFTWIVTKKTTGHVNPEMVWVVDLRKCYAQRSVSWTSGYQGFDSWRTQKVFPLSLCPDQPCRVRPILSFIVNRWFLPQE